MSVSGYQRRESGHERVASADVLVEVHDRAVRLREMEKIGIFRERLTFETHAGIFRNDG